MLPVETAARIGVFAGVFAVMALWEVVAQRRERRCPRPGRWFANLGIVVVDTAVVRLVIPLTLAGTAVIAETQGWGLLNNVAVPRVAAIVASVVALDLAMYLQHIVFHAVPVLWRLHMVHHADIDFDCTSGLRFHPIETLLSTALKMATVVLLGAPALATVIFEILLNGCAIFNHGNVSLPRALEGPVRWLVVTPDMHRVHHSVDRQETNSNFGFCLSLWDRLLGTYRAQPRAGHDDMQIGLDQFQAQENQNLPWLLGLPFRGDTGEYPMLRGDSSSDPP